MSTSLLVFLFDRKVKLLNQQVLKSRKRQAGNCCNDVTSYTIFINLHQGLEKGPKLGIYLMPNLFSFSDKTLSFCLKAPTPTGNFKPCNQVQLQALQPIRYKVVVRFTTCHQVQLQTLLPACNAGIVTSFTSCHRVNYKLYYLSPDVF